MNGDMDTIYSIYISKPSDGNLFFRVTDNVVPTLIGKLPPKFLRGRGFGAHVHRPEARIPNTKLNSCKFEITREMKQ